MTNARPENQGYSRQRQQGNSIQKGMAAQAAAKHQPKSPAKDRKRDVQKSIPSEYKTQTDAKAKKDGSHTSKIPNRRKSFKENPTKAVTQPAKHPKHKHTAEAQPEEQHDPTQPASPSKRKEILQTEVIKQATPTKKPKKPTTPPSTKPKSEHPSSDPSQETRNLTPGQRLRNLELSQALQAEEAAIRVLKMECEALKRAYSAKEAFLEEAEARAMTIRIQMGVNRRPAGGGWVLPSSSPTPGGSMG
ncbi:hypothetical protein BJX61DRAFT_546152 [Aspergillus egyptiacus]|nr:hypothetical protein BJX61DRAFT_546152 [Aspergillus egyptiacus]